MCKILGGVSYPKKVMDHCTCFLPYYCVGKILRYGQRSLTGGTEK